MVLEKLYRARWGPEDGVGCIIMSPTRESAGQHFDVLKSVGKHHSFSAGLLIGGRKDVDTEKEHANELNILVCTPGRLLQHMDETCGSEPIHMDETCGSEPVAYLWREVRLSPFNPVIVRDLWQIESPIYHYYKNGQRRRSFKHGLIVCGK